MASSLILSNYILYTTYYSMCITRTHTPQRQRSVIPCYWESQPSGCLKAHCPFLHTKPRPQLPNVTERVSQFKFATIDIKSLDELRKGVNKATVASSKQGGHQAINSTGNDSRFGVQNSTGFRFVANNHKTAPPTSQNQTQPRLADPTRSEGGKSTTIPSFELGTVLKDVVSRLNSSSTASSRSSSVSTCVSNATTAMASGSPIPTISLYSAKGSIFNTEVRPGSIFGSNLNQVVPAERAPIDDVDLRSTLSSQRSIKSTPFGDVNIITTSTHNKRPRHLDVAMPDPKRVSPSNLSIIDFCKLVDLHVYS